MKKRLDQLPITENFPYHGLTALFLYIKSFYILMSLFPVDPMLFVYSLIAFIPILFFISISFSLKDHHTRTFLFGLDVVLSLVFLADVLYARGFGRLFSIYVLFARGVSSGMGSSVISLLHPSDLILFLDLPILWYLRKRLNGAAVKRQPRLFFRGATLSVLLLVVGIGVLDATLMTSDLKNVPLYMSPLGAHIYDIYNFAREKEFVITPPEVESIKAWHTANLSHLVPAPEQAHLAGSLAGKNLIVIQFESLENFLIGRELYGQEITPNLNRLLDSSYYFSNLVEQVKEGNSSDAELLFNTSLYPLREGSAFIRFGDNQYRALPVLLKEQGYTSVAMHGDDASFWNRGVVLPNMGYERYVDESQFEVDHQVGMGVLDEYLFEQAIHEMKTLPEPFNLFLITLTTHIPFRIPEELQTLTFDESVEQDVSTDYLQSIHYVDGAFGRFYDQLKASGQLEDSVLVIYGDHESIHKYHETDLPANGKRLPYIIHSPGITGQVIDKPAGQVDMMPTLLYLMGLDSETYSDTVMGRNLFGTGSGSSILSTGQIDPAADDQKLLHKAHEISDLAIRSNYQQQFLKPGQIPAGQ